MILREIKIYNFKSHTSSKITFGEGIITIIGENGSGKSSIFDAVFFALFGAGSNFNYDTIITRGRKSVYVELSFEIKGNVYKIRREYDVSTGRGRAELYKNGKKYATTISAVNKAVGEILGVDKNMFLNSIYIKQGEITKFLTLRPSERMETVAKLLGIEDFEKCYSKMGEVIKNYEMKLKEIEGELKNKKIYEDELHTIIKNLNDKMNELSKVENELDLVTKEFNRSDSLLKSLEEKRQIHEKLINKLEDNRTSRKIKLKELELLENDLEIVINANNTIKKYENKYYEYIKITNDIKEIESKLKILRHYYDKHLKLTEQYKSINEDISRLKNLINKSEYGSDIEKLEKILCDVKNEIQKIELIKDKLEDLKNIEEEIKKIEEYKKIKEFCKKYYEKYLELEKQEEQYVNLNLEYMKLLQEKKSIEESFKSTNKSIKKLKEEIKDIDIDKIEHSLRELEEKKNLLKKLEKDKNMLNKKLGEINSEITQLKKILDDLKDVRGKCPLCKSPIDELKKRALISDYKAQLYRKVTELDKIHKEISEVEKKIDMVKKDIEKEKELREIRTLYLEKIKQINELEGKLSEYEDKLHKINVEIQKYIIDGKSVDKILKETKDLLKDLKKYYNQYISAVDTLNKMNESRIRKRLKELREEVKDWTKDRCNKKLQTLREKELEIELLLNKLKELANKEKKLGEIKNKISENKEYYEEYKALNKKLEDLKSRADELEKAYHNYKAKILEINNMKRKYGKEDIEEFLNMEIRNKKYEIEEIKEKIQYISKKIEEIGYNEDKYIEIKNQYENLKKKCEDIKNKKTKIETEISYLKRDIEKLNDKLNNITKLEKEKEKLEKFIDYLTKIRKIFSRSGFQAYLREKYVPLIQKYLNDAFNEFELPYSFVELTKDFEVKIHTSSGVLTIDNLSGGEQIAVALSLRLAIANALIGSSIECIILDEPTVYLDENRRSRLAEIFKKVKSIPQMIIITHHRELESIADEVINIKKEGNISKIEQ